MDNYFIYANSNNYFIYPHQCRLLERALQRYRAVLVSRGSPLQIADFDGHELPRWQALLDECSNGDSDTLSLLRIAVKREENTHYFSEALKDLYIRTIMLFHLYDLEYTPNSKDPMCRERHDLLNFLRSAETNLCFEAASKDRSNLLAWVTQIIQSDHDDNTRSLARFLDGVLRAATLAEAYKARKISADQSLVYGNTLGHGGNAKVVKASWNGVGGFAVKENKVRYFHDKEVEAMLDIRHANVMHMIAYSSEASSEQGINERNVVLMDLMDGDLDGFLSELFKKGLHSKHQLNICMDMLVQIAKGLKYLHKKKIVHRDLKPANILREKQSADFENFILKIADFGSSKSPFDHRTVATAPVGTRMYMAPEMLCEDGDTSKYGPEVDIYSFAMICYKVLTGMDPSDLTRQDVCQGKRPPLRASASCPQAMVSFIHKCWHQDPDMRPSAAQVYEFLYHFKYMTLLTTPARETSCLPYGIPDTFLEKLVSFLGKEWLETEARALEEGTSAEDMKLRKQVTDFLSRLSKKPQRNWLLSLPFFRGQ